jgi:hypothetical protein
MNGDCWVSSELAWWRMDIVTCFTLQRLSGRERTSVWSDTSSRLQDKQERDWMCFQFESSDGWVWP